MRKALLALFSCALVAGAEGLSLGERLGTLEVSDLEGKQVFFSTAGKTTVLIFTSTQCPISNGYNDRMSEIYRLFEPQGVQFVLVNANRNESPDEIAEHRKRVEFPFPVYKDQGNVLADRVGATVTPETYVFDSTGTLRYHGQIDDSRNPARVHLHALSDALAAVLAGRTVERKETKAFGCTIKRARTSS